MRKRVGRGLFAPYWSDIKRSPAEAYDDEYRRYLKQIKCTHFLMDKLIKKLDSNPETKNSTIVIQGDHGSRLISAYPFLENIDRFSEEDYIQSFSNFFCSSQSQSNTRLCQAPDGPGRITQH